MIAVQQTPAWLQKLTADQDAAEKRAARSGERRAESTAHGVCARCVGRGYVESVGRGRGQRNVGNIVRVQCPVCRGMV